jgi:ABC-type lipoprotein export system ATPase subunit
MQIVFSSNRGNLVDALASKSKMLVSRLELRGVSKTYRNGSQPSEVLHDISLAPAPGAVTALVGRSGCGKTTLLHLAGAMDFPTAGEVLIDGRATGSLSDAELTALRRTRVGFVFQFFQLLPTLTALENVELPLLLARVSGSTEAARDRLRWVGLEDKAASLPYQLSGGQMQRVAIARALVHSPGILIADEPTGNLDTASGDQVLGLLRDAATKLGATVLMATHSAEAAAIADARVHLRDGRIQSVP